MAAKTGFRNLLRIEWLYLALALALPWLPMRAAPDTIFDYYPIRDLIRAHPFEPGLWIDAAHAYRVPGYSAFLALLSLVSLSETWIRLVQGLLLLHTLVIGKRLAARLGASPRAFAWTWTITLVHFHFAQLALSETLAAWLLMMALGLAQERQARSFQGRGMRSGVALGLSSFAMVMVKPAFTVGLPFLLWPYWRRKSAIAVLLILVAAWGMALKPKAGKWVYLGAGGGLNLFIATLPGTFQYEGDELDRYWIAEQRKVGHPGEMGWYAYDEALKKEAYRRIGGWSIVPKRFLSPFFGLQYARALQWKLIPFGLVMMAGAACALFLDLPLVSLLLLSGLGAHFLLAPFARFVAPLAPLAAILIAKRWARVPAASAVRRLLASLTRSGPTPAASAAGQA